MKIFIMIITRIIELVILYFLCTWLFNSVSEPYNLWLIIALIVLYTGWFAVTLNNDIKEMKYGEGEPKM